MPIERSLRTPTGEQEEPLQESLFEVEDEDVLTSDNRQELEDGSVVFGPEPAGPGLATSPHDANLAELMDEDTLTEIGDELRELVEADLESRGDWVRLARDGLEELGFKMEERDFPFPGAASATHPLLAENVIKYQAKAQAHLLPPEGPIRTRIQGEDTPEKRAMAATLRESLNNYILYEMPEYETEHDRLLFYKAFYGTAFSKMWFDPARGRPVSAMVKPQNLVIDYYATCLETAGRVAEIITLTGRELDRYVASGLYRADIDLTEAENPEDYNADEIEDKVDEFHGRSEPAYDLEETYELYEIHVDYVLPDLDDLEEGEVEDDEDVDEPLTIAKPYIITVDAGTGQVLSIYRNWREGDTTFKKINYYTDWHFVPGFGFYSFGYLHLIGGLAKTATSTLRQLMDAGTLANLPGGFKAHGLRVVGGTEPIAPGEWRDVNVPGQDLAKALLPLPYKEPSATLMSLLQFVVDSAQRFADSTEQVVSESTNYGPVGTTMALLEQGGKLFNAIHKRLFTAQRKELQIFFDLMRNHADELQTQLPIDINALADVTILPETDPRTPSEAQRIARVQAQLQIAGQFPQIHGEQGLRELILEMHTALGVQNPERYVPPPPQPQQLDPISENVAVMQGQPIQAFPDQDHDSHIKVHMAFMQTPGVSNNQELLAALLGNIRQHIGFKYQQAMAQALQQATPQQQQQAQVQIEQAAAQVAEQVANQLLADEEARKHAEEMRDPVIRLQFMEVENRQAELLQRIEDMLLEHEREREEMYLKSWTDLAKEGVKQVGDARKELRKEQAKGARDYGRS